VNGPPLNIGIVCYPTVGGSGVVATELGKSLASKGHQVHFITSGHPARLREFEENVFLHRVETGDYPLFQQYTPYSLSLAVKIREVSVQYDLDVVHVHYAIPHAASAFLAKEMLKPCHMRTMTTLHGTDITLVGMMPSFYEITRFSINVSDRITAVSDYLRRQTLNEFHVEKPIEVIYNFVDTDEFVPGNSAQLRERFAPNGEFLLMHASNFRKVKNLPAVVKIFSEVRKEVKCRLVLIGDGPEREAVERMCADLGVADDVLLLGNQEHIASILPVGDVFLLPSEHESFGLAALEAMSCGVPVVASNSGGLPEVIQDQETGYLCDPHDVSCMKEIVLGLLRNQELRQKVAAASRTRVINEFGREQIVAQYIAAYRRLVEETNE
jgi:N-acetyl-alpha-D-glucosaminyl L-malate synthase BshA